VGTQIASVEEWEGVHGEKAVKDVLVVAQTYVSWCGPTDAITQTFKSILMDYEGRKIKICSVCVDEIGHDSLAKYQGTSKPNFLIYKNGEQMEVIEGVNAPLLRKSIADHIPDGMVDTGDDEAPAATEENEDY